MAAKPAKIISPLVWAWSVLISRSMSQKWRSGFEKIMTRGGRGRLDSRVQEKLLGLISPEKQGCYEEIRLARLCKSDTPP